MKTISLREEFAGLFPTDSCLRTLAAEIASVGLAHAKSVGLLTAIPAPFNLLSNGAMGSGWIAPTHLFPNDLVAWKQGGNGFPGPTQRGFSLMFDPFVDACLLIEARKGGGPFKTKTKVLVLTDYGPLKNVIGEMAVLPGLDWAEVETDSFLEARNLGPTGCNLFKALMEKASIGDVRKAGPEAISEAFSKHSLLIWNYFPFLRGGNDCEGMAGLPHPKNCAWIDYCDELLGEFLKCVNADGVLFAANKEVRGVRKSCVSANDPIATKYTYHELDHPRSWFGERRIGCLEKLRTALNG